MSHAYVHGTAPSEQDRLQKLNAITNESYLDFLGLKPDFSGVILDVGSGLGILAAEIAKRFPKSTVWGVEYSADQLALARKRTATNLRFVQGNAEAMTFETGFFDVVYCRYLLEHLESPLRAIQEMKRVLKPGGLVHVQENNVSVNVLYPECRTFELVWGKFAKLQSSLGGDPTIGKKLHSLFLKAGFSDLHLSIAPEVHYSGQPLFREWIQNLIGNIEGVRTSLLENELVTESEIDEALVELDHFSERNDASAYFYWNRLRARHR